MKEFVEKLIERLGGLKTGYEDYPRKIIQVYADDKIDSAMKIVKELAEEYKSNLSETLTSWIPCSERLPEDGNKVIITTKAGNVMAGIYTKHYGFRKNEGFTCDVCFIYLESVVAWMPLPEPYKPKEIPADHYVERFNRVN